MAKPCAVIRKLGAASLYVDAFQDSGGQGPEGRVGIIDESDVPSRCRGELHEGASKTRAGPENRRPGRKK